MNKALFRSIMVLHGDTNKSLSEYLGISEQSCCNKINEYGTEFRKNEIAKIKIRYDLSSEQLEAIFFAE